MDSNRAPLGPPPAGEGRATDAPLSRTADMDALDRLYFRLRQALAGRPSDRSVTIAEIYQQLVPYRAVRGELGYSELAEYEHALLRLLGGERGYAQVDVASVQEEIQRELRSPNPILGLYRDYAAVDVRISAAAAARTIPPSTAPAAAAPASTVARPPAGPSPPVPTPPRTNAADSPPAQPALRPGGAAPRPTPATASASPPRPAAPAQAASGRAPAPPSPSRPDTAQCWSCSASLPGKLDVRFCPFCGEGQKAHPCAQCRTPLQPRWSFCASCGAPAPRPQGKR
jgi:hypothetical protein